MDNDFTTILHSFEKMKIDNKVLDLEFFENMMEKYTVHQNNYFDFAIFVRRMVPYIQHIDPNIQLGDDVKRIL